MKKLFNGMGLMLAMIVNVDAQVSVGWEASCDYDESQAMGQLQQAISDGNSEIRVTNEQEFTAPIVINDSVIIKGGYNNCSDADNDIQSQVKSTINGSTLTQAAIKIDTSSAVRDIRIERFEIKNVVGNNDIGAGISVYNSSGQIDFSQLYVHDNTSDNVGGIAVKHDVFFVGSVLQVELVDTLVVGNSSGFNAGGIGCYNEASSTIRLTVSGESGVSFNHSNANGGGMVLSHCELFFASGSSTPSELNPLGIHANTANGFAGGLAVLNASEVTLIGTHTAPVNVTANVANFFDTSAKDGGGIYIQGDSISEISSLNATNVLIGSNTSNKGEGGGIFANYSSEVTINSDQRNCDWSQLCSLIEANVAKNGGAVGIENSGKVTVSGTEIKGNRAASSGSVAYLYNEGSELVFESNLIHHNGGADHTDFFDWYLIKNGFGNNSITVAYSTLVDNDSQFASISAYSSGGNLQLFSSIVDDPGIAAVSVLPAVLLGAANCNILGNDASITNLPAYQHIFEGTPAFVDRVNQDYHLDPMLTIGIDRCAFNTYPTDAVDIDGNVRDIDHPDFINDVGTMDIGIDEVAFDLIFKNSFE